jgi:hypothetical protein
MDVTWKHESVALGNNNRCNAVYVRCKALDAERCCQFKPLLDGPHAPGTDLMCWSCNSVVGLMVLQHCERMTSEQTKN